MWGRLLAGESAVREVTHPLLDQWKGRWLAAMPADAGHAGLSLVDRQPHRDAVRRLLTKTSLDPGKLAACVGASKGDLSLSSDPAEGPGRFAPSSVLDDLRGQFLLGPTATCMVGACASGLLAVMRAADWVDRGDCLAALAGAADYSLNPAVLASYRRAGVVSRWAGEPRGAVRPFCEDRSGFVIGEGGGFFAVESPSEARARGVRPLAVLSGWDTRTDPADLMALDPSGRAIAVTVRNALRHAGLDPAAVDAVCCHGTATRRNDVAESRGLRAVFGDRLDAVPCFSLKSAIGHTLGASGAVELACCVAAVQSGALPVQRNAGPIDPACPIGPVPDAPRVTDVGHVLKLSFGFGGHVAAVVVSRAE